MRGRGGSDEEEDDSELRLDRRPQRRHTLAGSTPPSGPPQPVTFAQVRCLSSVLLALFPSFSFIFCRFGLVLR